MFPFYHLLLVFAGDSKLIAQWKDWLARGAIALEMPPTEKFPDKRIAVTLTDTATEVVLFEHGQLLCKEQFARFAGSGKLHAYGYWLQNNDACLAVHYATTMDPFSGGAVKYFRFVTGENNLRETNRVEQFAALMEDEGYIMKLEPKDTPVPVKEAMKTDPEVVSMIDRLKSGEMSLESPDSDALIPWTEEDKQDFCRILQREIAPLFAGGKSKQ
jgi:hypothetical protein